MMSELDDTAAVEAALTVLRNNGIDIPSPRDGDLDDLEQERFNAFVDACREYRRVSPSQVAPANPAQVMDALGWAIAEIEERTRYDSDNQFENALTEAKKALSACTAEAGANMYRAPVDDDELQEWANLRADDAGRLARELVGYRLALTDAIGAGGQAVGVKPLIWEEDHGIAGMGPYRLFKAETPLGRFVYGTDAEGSAYYHTASSGIMMVGDEATAKRLAEAAWEKAALTEVGKYVDFSALAHPSPATVGVDAEDKDAIRDFIADRSPYRKNTLGHKLFVKNACSVIDAWIKEYGSALIPSPSAPAVGEEIASFKWLDPECGQNGCQSLVWKSRYESAVKGRADFRQAYREARATAPSLGEITEDAVAAAIDAWENVYEAEIKIGASSYTDNKEAAMRAALTAALSEQKGERG